MMIGELPDLPPLPPILDLLGIALFAFSGALAGTREKQTFVTVAFFALVTGVGGGSLRDLLIGAPVFWIRDPFVAPICLAVALFAWFTPQKWWSERILEWADAAGLAGYAVFGTVKAMRFGIPPVTAILMGIVTGCAGGIIRDVVAGRPSIIMRPEIYVTAAALSASLAAIVVLTGLPLLAGGLFATLAGLALRGAAIRWSLALPTYGKEKKD
jgi:uncharacterized membrane protein YeiH